RDPGRDAGERRQLTVMFCDLVGSTALSGQLDPEDLREVMRAYQETAAAVITRYDGYIAQYLGDGLLVYFGYPQAHEDDARRAVRAGLEIVEAIGALNIGLKLGRGVRLAVRLGIHTGLVVVGEIGGGGRRERLALGETPNVAARLQGLAEPDTVVISAATARLVQGVFTLEDRGTRSLKGVEERVGVSRVLGPVERQGDDEEAAPAEVRALVGRDEEVGLLRRRWEQSKEGLGQVVLISGDAGIGKSALVERVRADARYEGATRILFHCSPYHQNSALYPVIEHLQRLLHWQRDDVPAGKLDKLEHLLGGYHFPHDKTAPLFAALLSLPLPEGRYPPLGLTPQQQKQHTLDALAAWLVEETEYKPVLTTWEDLQWADPSSLELLGLIIDQTPTVRMLNVLTFRPEFVPPWPARSHLTPLTLNRLERPQVEAIITQLTGGKVLPKELVQHVVSKTDGVPLFVEEFTKMVLEAGILKQVDGRYELNGPLSAVTIPSTLQDSLMARLDRLPQVREIAQLGAVLGREFAYEMIRALTTVEESELQQRLMQLVEVELFYQRGRPPRAKYVFKHALIQDAAYASLLRSTRQHYHQQIARLFENQFPEMVDTQPELVAHHYTEAGCLEQAIVYWQRAGQHAVQLSANAEAISHLTEGLKLLAALPGTPERARWELELRTTLGPAVIATKGFAAAEVEQTYSRARELCLQLGETTQLSPALLGLSTFYLTRGEFETARELGGQLLNLGQSEQDSALLVEAHSVLGTTLFHLGELALAREHLEQGIARYDVQQHRSLAFLYGQDPGVFCLCYMVRILWFSGYPDQALQRSHEATTLAQELSHPFSLALAYTFAALVSQLRREGPATQEWAEKAMAVCTKHGFAFYSAMGTILRGWALVEQGQSAEGIAQIHQGLTAWRATGSELFRPHLLALLAEGYGKTGQAEEGLGVLAEAFGAAHKSGRRFYEAELYRLYGELLLRNGETETGRTGDKRTFPDSPIPRFPDSSPEECFLRALDLARQQGAKAWELRAVVSLSRLWQSGGKKNEARQMLKETCGWFSEGFATADLREAKALLEALS
ncbi:MAG TPA: adenylate/guanylate cyclase domain-containing protein, partial [Candidatus Binatia bacterium]|nr:adenylate/guanylate cyclase domain-containing protein [Candidatus Binatia bacterium]